MNSAARDSDIAIIGMACRFPGANDLNSFWNNLCEGIESISFFEEKLASFAVTNETDYIWAGSLIENIEFFDADFFNYNARDAEITDPQHRIFLECSWEALEDGGCDPYNYKGLIGVYAGAGLNSYLINNVLPSCQDMLSKNFLGSMINLKIMIGNDKDYLPTQVSYKFNLRGPSVNIQTACSTSLVAVHSACQSILNGECDMALAGAASIIVPQKSGYSYQEDMIFSPDGHCRTFDAEARGTVFGSGVGVILLKPLQKAIDDRNAVYAVIKGTAINNDGNSKIGYTSPSVEGQAAVIKEALAVSEVNSETITYIEAHGTATALGDPIEVQALTQAFNTLKKGFCAIGSVKTNFGHLGWAAGIAGLIKTALALQYKKIPPSLHFKKPNPGIDFDNSPFYVNTILKDWETNNIPRRAGVSAFGIGGTNAHVVLEEFPEITSGINISHAPWHILTISTKSQKGLVELVSRYKKIISSMPDNEFQNICYTSNIGRKHFNYRLAIIASSCKHAFEKLGNYIASKAENISTENSYKELILPKKKPQNKQIAFLFGGHGTQYLGMGRQLYEAQPIFRKVMDECNALFKKIRNIDLLDILYLSDLNDTRINLIEFSQPALFSLELALATLWKAWGIIPNYVMGYGLGEYAAACIAGVFSLEDGLKMVAHRSFLLQPLLELENIETIIVFSDIQSVNSIIAELEGKVFIAAENTPNNVIISGCKVYVEKACARFTINKIRIKKLKTSTLEHTTKINQVAQDFKKILNETVFALPKLKIISNITGLPVKEEIATADYWCQHILKPIKFMTGLNTLRSSGVGAFIEISSIPFLVKIARKCLDDYNAILVSSLCKEQGDLEKMLNSIGKLYEYGYTINWENFHENSPGSIIHLPTYPFQRQKYWLGPNDEENT